MSLVADYSGLLPAETLTVKIPGVPFAQPRTGQTRSGVRFLPAKARTWRKYAQDCMMAALDESLRARPAFPEGPVGLRVVATWPMPRSRYLKRFPRPAEWRTQRPDMKNVLWAVEDAAEGFLFGDDSQVVHFGLYKVTGAQGEPPGTVVEVWQVVREPE